MPYLTAAGGYENLVVFAGSNAWPPWIRGLFVVGSSQVTTTPCVHGFVTWVVVEMESVKTTYISPSESYLTYIR